MLRAPPSPARRLVAAALCAFAYLYVFPYQESLNNPNENARFYMTAALVEEGSYVLNGMRARWGWVNDCAIYEGRAYSVKAPGSSLLGVPAYYAYFHGARLLDHPFDRTEALWACRVFGSILPWLVFLWFFYRWLGRRASSGLVRDAVFVSVALGSCLYGYGLLFASHSLSAASAFAAFMLLSDAKRAGRITEGRAFLAGLLTAGVTLLEYPGFVVSAVLAFYALYAIRPRQLLLFAGGALIPTLAMMHFQWSCFGSPFTPGHRYVESDAFRAAHHEGFFGAVGWQWDAVYGLLFHPGAGLWPLTPILIFAIPGLVLAWRRARAEAVVSMLVVLGTIASIAVMNNWRGGWTIGPRYLAVVYPFLGWGALVGLGPIDRRWPSWGGMLALGTTAASIALSAIPSAYYPHYPPEIDRPLAQVVLVLWQHDYAPLDAAGFFGVHGSPSMRPLFLVLALSLVWIAWAGRGLRVKLASIVGGAALCVAIVWPLSIDPRPRDPQVRAAVAVITRGWRPAGHDAAARLALAQRGHEDAQGLLRLAELYDAEGRDLEAAQFRARAERLARRP